MELEEIRDRIKEIDIEGMYCWNVEECNKLSGLLVAIERALDKGGVATTKRIKIFFKDLRTGARVQALQFTEHNSGIMAQFLSDVKITTVSGVQINSFACFFSDKNRTHHATVGDWIVKDTDNDEYLVVGDKLFEENYEAV